MSIEKTPDLGTKRLRRLKLREISGDTRFVQRATIEPKKPPFQKQKRVLFSVPSETTRPVSLTVKLPALKNTGVDRLADGGSAGFAAGFAGSGEDATNGAKGVATNGARMLLGAPGLTTGNKKLLGVLSRARARAGGEDVKSCKRWLCRWLCRSRLQTQEQWVGAATSPCHIRRMDQSGWKELIMEAISYIATIQS